MSIRVMTAVWDKGTRYAEGSLLVLLAMADWANDDGRCFPSMPELAAKSRLTERQVYAVLKLLKADCVLESTGEVAIRDLKGKTWRFLKGESGGRGRRTVYRINTEMLSGNRKTKPEKIAGFNKPQNPEVGDAETLKSAQRNPEVGDTPLQPPLGNTANAPSGKTVNKKHSPCPLAGEGVKEPRVDGMTWGRFRDGLRRQLENAPLKHLNFTQVVKGEWDFNACFRDWWLIGLEPPGERAKGPPRLLTEADDARATSEGLRKYRKRIEALSREHFGVAMEIVVQERKASVQ